MTDIVTTDPIIQAMAEAIYCETRREGLLWPRIYSWGECRNKHIYLQEAQAALSAAKPLIEAPLREALEPFAKLSAAYKEHGGAWEPEHKIYERDGVAITIGDLRKAEQALQEKAE